MAKSCPRDLIRAVVERTLEGDALGDATDVSVAEEHLEKCASCRAFKARLERDERSVRRAVRDLADSAAGDECPSPADLAAFSDGKLEGARRDVIETHCVHCELCRSVSSISSVVGSAPADAISEEQLAPARRRLAVARATHDAAEPSRRTATGRTPSARTTSARATSARRRAAARPPEGPSRSSGPLVAAAAAVAFVAGALVMRGATPTDTGAPGPEPRPVPAPTLPSVPAPVAAPTPAPAPGRPEVEAPLPADAPPMAPAPEDDVVARRGESDRPSVPQDEPTDAAPAPVPPPAAQPTKDVPGTTTTPAPRPTTPAPVTPAPVTPAPAGEFCSIADFSGPLEIRKREAKAWRKMVLSDVVAEGDGLRSRGQASNLTLTSRAKFTLAADAVATTAVTKSSVRIRLEAGRVEGESLAFNGLEVEDRNGTVTVWQGAKVLVEATESGLHIAVESGRAWVANAHGRTLVHAGQEIVLVADRKPAGARKRP